MDVAAAWAEVRMGLRKSDNRKSIYMILEVVVALAEARVGVKRSDRLSEQACSVCSRVGLLCLF